MFASPHMRAAAAQKRWVVRKTLIDRYVAAVMTELRRLRAEDDRDA